jgi:4-hydroxy-tetrahydrodipicolinate synthase
MSKFRGTGEPSTYVISITPFAKDSSFDEEGIRHHLRRLRAAGIGVYVGGGGSGEGFAMSADEHKRLLDIAVEELKGGVPIRAMGTEPRTASQMVEYVGIAQSAGVDAAQIYSLDQGHGHQPFKDEIRTYFTEILDAVDIPSIISTHQSVGYLIPIELLDELVDRYPHVVGINCSTGDVRYLIELIDTVGDRVEIHVGGPFQALSALSLGATGFLSSEGNLAPKLCVSVIDSFKKGDLDGAFDSYARVARLSRALYNRGGIRATKAVLTELGLAGGYPRRPQLEVSATVVGELMELVRGLDLANIEGWPATDA